MTSPRRAGAAEPMPSELNTSSSLAFLEVGKDKLSVKYNGPAQHDNDVGCIQSNHPVPRRRLLYYFEVAVREAGGGSIAVGFSDRNLKQGRHPGHEPHSYGYRGDTGRKHHSGLPARGEEYGPAFGPGDVVGAGIHLTQHEIFFTKNGQHLGTAFRGVSCHPLFPTIGLHSQGARVEVNFGQQPFQFDPAALEQRELAERREALLSTTVSAGEVHQMVRQYLLHYGYAESLAAFDEAAGMAAADAAAAAGGGPGLAATAAQQQQGPGAASGGASASANGCAGAGASSSSHDTAALGTLGLRAQLRQLLMSGGTAAARQLLQQQAPALLPAESCCGGGGEASPGGAAAASSSSASGGSFELQFHLACQQYIELIRGNDIAGALAYAEGTLATLRSRASPEQDALLRDVVALIAYQQPEQSPLAHLLLAAQREATADVVNAALLGWRAPPGSPEPQAALELVLQQLTAVQREVHELAGGHGPEFDLQEHLPQPAAAALQAQQQAAQGGGGGAAGATGAGAGGTDAPASEGPVPMAE